MFVILPSFACGWRRSANIISYKVPRSAFRDPGVSFFIIAPFSGMDLATFGGRVAGLEVFAACFPLFALNM